jgi:CBS domain-containing protein
MRKFFAQDIMTQPVYTFKKIEKVAHVYKVLKTTTHNGYPIVNHDGTFCGLILRSQLVTLLKGRDFSRIVTEVRGVLLSAAPLFNAFVGRSSALSTTQPVPQVVHGLQC